MMQIIKCMTFDSVTNHLYVGMDNGVVKIYAYNPDLGDKRRFVVRPFQPS
jgi:hypothetical protein